MDLMVCAENAVGLVGTDGAACSPLGRGLGEMSRFSVGDAGARQRDRGVTEWYTKDNPARE